MPFDETPDNGGGGGDDRHDPYKMEQVLNASLEQLKMNTRSAEVCESCATGVLIVMLADRLIDSAESVAELSALVTPAVEAIHESVLHRKEAIRGKQH